MTDTHRDPPRLSLTEVLGRHDTGERIHEMDPNLTIPARPSDPGPERPARLSSLRNADPRARIERREQIGIGGMGVVHLATQRSLGRGVAIKELREDVRTDRNATQLLNEAFVLGSLEHPNVVPVHELMLDDEGFPVVVMKRIEGEAWSDLLGDDATSRERYGITDALEWHISVLMKVCNALSFAHSRGVLHRDVKPENVMVGRFGEVYLVDWGVAAALRDDRTGRFPLVRDVESFAGTPRYMAPEMLGGRGSALTEKTDVYLLGATLFHVLTGQPPHPGENIMEIASHISVQDPELPEGVPPHLGEICLRAMARDPLDRFESVDAFRAALQDFSTHRHAVLLAEEGEAKLRELIALAQVAPDDPEAHRVRMFNAYSESRLGFRLARRIWPESRQAMRGLASATETMIDYLLRAGDVESATTLASQLEETPSPELASRLAEARAASATARRRLARLEKLDRNLDPTIGRRARLAVYSALTMLFLAIEATGHFHHPFETHTAFIGSSAALVAVAMLVGWLGRSVLMTTRLNRQIYAAILVLLISKVLVHVLTAILGHPPWHGHVAAGAVYFAAVAVTAIAHQIRFLPVAIALGAAALAGAWLPDQRYLFYAAACVITLATLAVIHREGAGAEAGVA